jgi:membrane protease YdiL (CAAX protease family)
VASQIPLVNPIGLVACGPSSSHTMIVNTQCQATTTSRLNALMKSTYLSRPRTTVPVVVVVVLVIGNILSNRVVPAALYVPVNLATATAVLLVARELVTTWDMGFKNWTKGARWGLAVMLVGLAAYLIAAVLPGFEDLFHDRRVSGGVLRVLYEAFIRIPFGTVVLEELAFRAALPAVFAKHMSVFRAAIVSSVLFGFWHVLPSLNLADVNPFFEWLLGDGIAGQVAGVAIAVFGTFLAGLWLSFLRFRSGSILAPAIAHWASNAGGYVLAWIFGGAAIDTEIVLR